MAVIRLSVCWLLLMASSLASGGTIKVYLELTSSSDSAGLRRMLEPELKAKLLGIADIVLVGKQALADYAIECFIITDNDRWSTAVFVVGSTTAPIVDSTSRYIANEVARETGTTSATMKLLQDGQQALAVLTQYSINIDRVMRQQISAQTISETAAAAVQDIDKTTFKEAREAAAKAELEAKR